MLSQGEILRNPSRTRFQKPIASRTSRPGLWSKISYLMTFLIFDCILSLFGMKTPEVRQAWREKVALCMCISLCCSGLAFLTYGMNRFICKGSNQYIFGKLDKANFEEPIVITNGSIFYTENGSYDRNSIYSGIVKIKSEACKNAFGKQLVGGSQDVNDLRRIASIGLEWSYIASKGYIVIDNKVYDPSLCKETVYEDFIKKYAGTEATKDTLSSDEFQCFQDSFLVGEVATKTPGCLIADTFLYISTVIIFSLIIAKFVLATVYSWYMRGRVRPSSCVTPVIMLVTCYSEGREGIKKTLDSLCKQTYDYDNKLIVVIADGEITGENESKTTPEIILDLCEINRVGVEPKGYISLMPGNKRYNKAMVYSGYYNVQVETEEFTGFKNDLVNAKNNLRTRILVIRKVGNSSEMFKAGNRGKRDSQVILMSFFSKMIYNDRMSELDFEIYTKMKELMPHIDPSDFEGLLMVDADTIVKPDALSKMVSIFETDPKVMGICGETMILNKCESWVTMIQVFEYYISHHLSKTFESVFGGVTCLPGCFCMYRIKINTDEDGNLINGYKSKDKTIFEEEKQRFCLPILANPFIINSYSVFEAKTLHQKNLLHLGEDRYLTTLLLKNFYKRKLVFVPQAQCETYVPSQFKVLLSQRRRWINSTIHNLFELVMVDKLCGAFCCSMQFVVLVELFGTLVLPAAILFTGVLIISSIVNEPAWIPLIMLACIFGLPAFLIMITTFKISYVFWLFVYILSLPIWNFVLPLYAFWHFDDFSWGNTRVVVGDDKADEEGEEDKSTIRLRELEDFLRNKSSKENSSKENSSKENSLENSLNEKRQFKEKYLDDNYIDDKYIENLLKEDFFREEDFYGERSPVNEDLKEKRNINEERPINEYPLKKNQNEQ
ncbi:Chitin synthase 1 [Nosema granulosis]|uniref:chitin synthase n=1 Tax=Nosema granulosis TaxID=83296 RepID=A0A9P6H185_9MICR|nr:Chitin synthase 1 [Nosema granulosis]